MKDQVREDRLSIVAPGVAFYALLAVFPALAALISVYGLVFDPQQISEQVAKLEGLLPAEAIDVLLGELQGLTRAGRTLWDGGLPAAWRSRCGAHRRASRR